MEAIQLLLESFRFPFMQNALAVIIPLALVTGLVGVFINLRGLEFVSDGLTHAVFPGLAAGFVVAGSPGLLPGALVAALLATLALTYFAGAGLASDTATAITLTGMFALGVLIVSGPGGSATSLESLLFGHLFTVSAIEAGLSALAAGVAAALVLITYRAQVFTAFDEVGARGAGFRTLPVNIVLNLAIALVVVSASIAVGNLLVLALLIVPGATARLLARKFTSMVVVSVVIAVGASITVEFHVEGVLQSSATAANSAGRGKPVQVGFANIALHGSVSLPDRLSYLITST